MTTPPHPPTCPDCLYAIENLPEPEKGASEWQIAEIMQLPGPAAAFRWLNSHSWKVQPVDIQDGRLRYKPEIKKP